MAEPNTPEYWRERADTHNAKAERAVYAKDWSVAANHFYLMCQYQSLAARLEADEQRERA